MSLAHLMTFLRIILIPFFPVIYLYGHHVLSVKIIPFLLIFFLLICQISDILDGIFARKRNEVTDLGKILDPMADSALSLSIFFSFTQQPISLPLILVFVFLYREFMISTLRILCALKGIALAARKTGKLKTILQAIVFFLILICMSLENFSLISLSFLQSFSFYSVLIIAIYTIVSAIDYLWVNRKHIEI